MTFGWRRSSRDTNPLDPMLKGVGRSAEEAAMKDLRHAVFDRDMLEQLKIPDDEFGYIRAYVLHLQGHLGKANIWHSQIAKGGEQGTRALIHEVVESRDLKGKGVDLLKYPPAEAEKLLAANKDSHVKALKAEYAYWEKRNPGRTVRDFVGTLNADDADLFLGA